jgi:hypothetical protein
MSDPKVRKWMLEWIAGRLGITNGSFSGVTDKMYFDAAAAYAAHVTAADQIELSRLRERVRVMTGLILSDNDLSTIRARMQALASAPGKETL